MPRNALITPRRDTAANWTSVNPVLAEGELGWEKDTHAVKMGDGTTAWNSLPYSIQPAAYAPVVNAQAYGAKVDGTTDDTAAVNAAVNAASAAGGGTVLIPSVGALNCILAGVVLKSKVRLRLGEGVTITRKTGYTGHIIQNQSFTPVATATDGAISSSSSQTVLTTSLASQAVVGQTVIVGQGGVASPGGAGKGGSLLVANVVSVGVGTITLSIAAQTTTTTANVALYNRDHDIYLDFGAGAGINSAVVNASTSPNPYPVYFRHVDRVGTSGIATIYDTGNTPSNDVGGFCFGDCTDIDVPYATTGAGTLSGCLLRFDGPCTNITVGTTTGTVTGDDAVAVLPCELGGAGGFAANADTTGTISGVDIGAVRTVSLIASGLRLTSSLQYGCPLSHVKVGQIVTSDALSSTHVAVDMSTNPDPNNSVQWFDIHLGYIYGLIGCGGAGTIDVLTIDFLDVPSLQFSNGLGLQNALVAGLIHIKGSYYNGTLLQRLVGLTSSAGVGPTVDTLIIERFDWTETTTGGSSALNFYDAGSTVKTAIIGPGTFNAGSIVTNSAGSTLTRVFYRDVTGGIFSRIGDFASTTELVLHGVDAPASGAALIVEATGVITLRGSGNNIAAPSITSGGTLTDLTFTPPPAKGFADLLGWSFDSIGAGASLGAQGATNLFLFRVPLLGTVTITDVLIYLTALGSTLTHSFVAVYRSDGTLVGQSADQSAAWGSGGSTGVKTIALASGPFTVAPLSANDFLWVGFYVGTATAGTPAFQGASTGTPGALWNVNTAAARSRAKFYTIADTATLPAVTPSGGTPWPSLGWVGLS